MTSRPTKGSAACPAALSPERIREILAQTARHKADVRAACRSTFRVGVAAALLHLAACGLAPGVAIPTYGAMALHDCPAWDVDEVAASLDAMTDALLASEVIHHREARAIRAHLGRTRVTCYDAATAPLSVCGDTSVHGGCMLWSDNGVDPHEIRLPVLDLDTDRPEDLCGSYLVVESAKVAAYAVGAGDVVTYGVGPDASPADRAWARAWMDAAWVCATGED